MDHNKLIAAELMFLLDHPEEYKQAILGIVIRSRSTKSMDYIVAMSRGIKHMSDNDIGSLKLPWKSKA